MNGPWSEADRRGRPPRQGSCVWKVWDEVTFSEHAKTKHSTGNRPAEGRVSSLSEPQKDGNSSRHSLGRLTACQARSL